ncbi:MAG: hypothetical protein D6E12_13230 [Desulfovibrio sp.]|nr:MAG: hypothetical protein D6E12_13230 [Desulfovibrio sp.]
MEVEAESQVMTNIGVEDGDDANFTSVTNEFSAGVSYPVWEGEVALELSYTLDSVSWNNPGDLPFGNGDDPWNTLHAWDLGLNYTHNIDDAWSLIFGVSGSSAYEIETANSFGISGHAGVSYVLDGEWIFVAGVSVSHDALGTDVMPFGMITWMSPDMPGLVAVVGLPETSLTVPLTETISIKGYGELGGSTHRLSDDSSVAAKGYVSQMHLDTGIDLIWEPLDNLAVTLGGAYRPWGKMELYDSDGDDINDYNTEGGWGGKLGVEISF